MADDADRSDKNKTYRKMMIHDFRNLGISYGKKSDPAELTLNRSLKKDELGDIVFLVGPNNSGKSNVLDAITACLRDGIDKERDAPDFILTDDVVPSVKFVVKDNNEEKYYFSAVDANNIQPSEEDKMVKPAEDPGFLEKYGYGMHPSVRKYVRDQIRQKDMSGDPMSLNRFLTNVLRLMGANEELLTAYKRSGQKKNTGYLSMVQNALNRDVEEKITKRFNNLYLCGGNEKYSFNFRVESSLFSLELYLGDKPLNLDYQSEGFKWFFDFYFNFICTGDLKWGDIILMDEPGTNLHVRGQEELRKYLKEFAKEQGLTFVISTHSPFLLDCDHLDEVRTLIRDDETGFVRIIDRFSVIGDDSDTLGHILNNLTVGRHVMYGPDQRVIFVEGHTDYCYLTAFKILMSPKYDRLAFLPIGGLGEKGSRKRENLCRVLLKIDRVPVLLTDGDAFDIKKKAENTAVGVISLNDVDIRFREIEDLFTGSDIKEFGLTEKSWDAASVFKNSIIKNADKISEETKRRFAKVLDRLLG